MIQEIVNFIFPCEKKRKALIKEHSEAIERNKGAHESLMQLCTGSACHSYTFPPLKERTIVNPR